MVFLFPWHRISFRVAIDEVPASAALRDNGAPATEIVGFCREDDKRR